MKCRILSEIDGRMRVRLCTPRMTLKQADIVEEYLSGVPGAKKVNVYDRNCNVVILQWCSEKQLRSRDAVTPAEILQQTTGMNQLRCSRQLKCIFPMVAGFTH